MSLRRERETHLHHLVSAKAFSRLFYRQCRVQDILCSTLLIWGCVTVCIEYVLKQNCAKTGFSKLDNAKFFHIYFAKLAVHLFYQVQFNHFSYLILEKYFSSKYRHGLRTNFKVSNMTNSVLETYTALSN